MTERSDKPVTLSRHRFHVARLIGGISQGLAELVDCRVQPLIEVDESRALPQALVQFFTLVFEIFRKR